MKATIAVAKRAALKHSRLRVVVQRFTRKGMLLASSASAGSNDHAATSSAEKFDRSEVFACCRK